jgi:hypothetical protein
MALICFNKGAQEILTRALNKGATGDVKLMLYKTNTALTETYAMGDATVADFTGYSTVTLSGASWTITDADPSSASYAKQTFTSSAGSQNQDIYGYIVTNSGGTIALWGETFTDGPYNIANVGDKIECTVVFTLD